MLETQKSTSASSATSDDSLLAGNDASVQSVLLVIYEHNLLCSVSYKSIVLYARVFLV